MNVILTSFPSVEVSNFRFELETVYSTVSSTNGFVYVNRQVSENEVEPNLGHHHPFGFAFTWSSISYSVCQQFFGNSEKSIKMASRLLTSFAVPKCRRTNSTEKRCFFPDCGVEEDGGFGIYGDKTRYATLQKKRDNTTASASGANNNPASIGKRNF